MDAQVLHIQLDTVNVKDYHSTHSVETKTNLPHCSVQSDDLCLHFLEGQMVAKGVLQHPSTECGHRCRELRQSGPSCPHLDYELSA